MTRKDLIEQLMQATDSVVWEDHRGGKARLHNDEEFFGTIAEYIITNYQPKPFLAYPQNGFIPPLNTEELEDKVAKLVMECAELFHEAYGQEPGQRAIDTWQTSDEPRYTAKRILDLLPVPLPPKELEKEIDEILSSITVLFDANGSVNLDGVAKAKQQLLALYPTGQHRPNTEKLLHEIKKKYLVALRAKFDAMEAAGMNLSPKADVWNQLEMMGEYEVNDLYEKQCSHQVDVEEAELVERFRKSLMKQHSDDWSMETISEAAHICAKEFYGKS